VIKMNDRERKLKESEDGFMVVMLESRIILLLNGIFPAIRKNAGLSAEFKPAGINPITGQEMLFADDEFDLPKKDKEMILFCRGAISEIATMLSHLPSSLSYDPSTANLKEFISEPTELMKQQEEE
tara:strand:+ start:2269 stop:2646 length:378 start_codon:yes stop_codon:yes gene_type:complete